jgi:hypothetical protein
MDFFDFFRYLLCTVVSIYVTLMTLQSALGWYKWLSEPTAYNPLLRSYLAVAALRLRLASFGVDLAVCLLLCVAFVLICDAHGTISQIAADLEYARRHIQPHYR